ncbi:MAG: hypothetical protein R2706_10325 [Acidimicrobiales bacterium]
MSTTLRGDVVAITSNGRVLRATAADLPEVGGRSRDKRPASAWGPIERDRARALHRNRRSPHHRHRTRHRKTPDREVLAWPQARPHGDRLVERDRVAAVLSAPEEADLVLVTTDARPAHTRFGH